MGKSTRALQMFVVLTVNEGICYFEALGVDKYTHVAVVDIERLDVAKEEEQNFVESTDDLIEAEITG